MMKARSLALVCAGPISRNGIARLPRIKERLGPVKCGTLQRASRAVNSLGSGTPVAAYQDIASSRTILVKVPDQQLSAVVSELALSRITWKQKIVLLCTSSFDSSELAPLTEQGADAGSFDAISGFDERRYVVEGTPPAVREMRALIQHGDVRVVEIRPGEKAPYLAGVACATKFLTSMVAAAVGCFRSAGLPLADAQQITAKLANQALRDYLKAGAKGVPVAEAHVLSALANCIEAKDPKLAEFFRKLVVSG